MNILIICDYSNVIGMGHIIRCNRLRNELQNRCNEVQLIINTNEDNLRFNISESKVIKDFACLGSIELLRPLDMIIVDVGANEVEKIKAFLKKNTHPILIIYDQLGEKIENYDLKVQPWPMATEDNARVASGLDYHVFSSEMYEKSKLKKNSKHVQKILISFGGSDKHNLSAKVSGYLADNFENLCFGVVIGWGIVIEIENELRALAAKYGNLIVYKQTNSIENIYLEYDMAIISGGQTKFELSLFGMPSLIVGSNELEKKLSIEYSELGSSIWINSGERLILEELKSYLRELVINKNKYESMVKNGKNIFKANGIDNLINKINEVRLRKRSTNCN
jgi:spore coat polysaccharide biosynthesis predicted glycosyltransferase SpsG